MKRITVLLLAVLMLAAFALTGCGAKDRMEGTWEGTVDLAPGMEEQFKKEGMEDLKLADSYKVTVTYEFKDGEYEGSVDEKDVKKTAEDVYERIEEYTIKAMEKELQEVGATEADFEAEYGMSIEDYVKKELPKEAGTADDLAEEWMAEIGEAKGEYELDGDELTLDGDDKLTFTIELKKNSFVITDCDDDESSLIYKDVTFKKK